jgi:F-type H+-transporting ATPase subunit b
LLWQFLNLAILLGVLGYFARKPVQKFFAERRSRIRGDLDQAASLLAEAERRYSEWQHKLIDLDEELAQIRADGRRHAEAEREAILADAQVAAERIHRNAVATVEQELRRAQSALRDEAAQLATELAERLLRERLEDSDRERLLDEFITRISPESGGATGGRA